MDLWYWLVYGSKTACHVHSRQKQFRFVKENLRIAGLIAAFLYSIATFSPHTLFAVKLQSNS